MWKPFLVDARLEQPLRPCEVWKLRSAFGPTADTVGMIPWSADRAFENSAVWYVWYGIPQIREHVGFAAFSPWLADRAFKSQF